MEQTGPSFNYRANTPPPQEPIQTNRLWSNLLPRMAIRFQLSESTETVAGEAKQTEAQRGQFIHAFDQISQGQFTEPTAYPLLNGMISSGLDYYGHFFRNHPEQGDQYRIGKDNWRNVPNQFTMPEESQKYRDSFGQGYDMWHKLKEANSETKTFQILPTVGANKTGLCQDMFTMFSFLKAKNEGEGKVAIEGLTSYIENEEQLVEKRKQLTEKRRTDIESYRSDVKFGGNQTFGEEQYRLFQKAQKGWENMMVAACFREESDFGTRVFEPYRFLRPGDEGYSSQQGRPLERTDFIRGGVGS